MPKNYIVEDIRSRSLGVIDIVSKNELVLDVKPKNQLVGEVDDVVVYLGAGMSIGPGWYMYVTYPNTIAVNP